MFVNVKNKRKEQVNIKCLFFCFAKMAIVRYMVILQILNLVGPKFSEMFCVCDLAVQLPHFILIPQS